MSAVLSDRFYHHRAFMPNLPHITTNPENTSLQFHSLIDSHLDLLTHLLDAAQNDSNPNPQHTQIILSLETQFQEHITHLLHSLRTYTTTQRILLGFIPTVEPTIEAIAYTPSVTMDALSLSSSSSSPNTPSPTRQYPNAPSGHHTASPSNPSNPSSPLSQRLKFYAIRFEMTNNLICRSWSERAQPVLGYPNAQYNKAFTPHNEGLACLSPRNHVSLSRTLTPMSTSAPLAKIYSIQPQLDVPELVRIRFLMWLKSQYNIVQIELTTLDILGAFYLVALDSDWELRPENALPRGGGFRARPLFASPTMYGFNAQAATISSYTLNAHAFKMQQRAKVDLHAPPFSPALAKSCCIALTPNKHRFGVGSLSLST
jgi:hypothetical protein